MNAARVTQAVDLNRHLRNFTRNNPVTDTTKAVVDRIEVRLDSVLDRLTELEWDAYMEAIES